MRLDHLLKHAGLHTPATGDPRANVRGVTEDSRLVKPGWIFIARPGLHVDGRQFIPDAIQAGAILIVTDQNPTPDAQTISTPILKTHHPAKTGATLAEILAGNPSKHLRLAGVTGTNGKSTVTSLISQIANHAQTPCGLIGTVNIDDGSNQSPSDFTTPPAERLSTTLAQMVRNQRAAAAIEVSSHALHQHRVAGLRFAAAVFTNLTGDHLDYHKDMHAYAQAKATLFAGLDHDAIAVVNADDPATDTMLNHCIAPVVACSFKDSQSTKNIRPGATNAQVEIVSTDSTGTQLRITGLGTESNQKPHPIEAHTSLFGRHNAMNLLQAVAVCTNALDISSTKVAEAIPTLKTPNGRLERVTDHADQITVFVDFAHTDDALDNALRAARLVTPREANLWVIFGCGGNKDRAKRPRMGRAAATLADKVVATSDNPRTESPLAILDEVIAGIPAQLRHAVHIEPDRRAAIDTAIANAMPGDVLVIAGKGHEREQILSDAQGNTRPVPFDDHEIARKALIERKDRTQRNKRPAANPPAGADYSGGAKGAAPAGGTQ